MALLRDILDYDLLQKHLADGVVRRQSHPAYPDLFIYNYTEQATFGRIWDNVTNVCRGLIVADDEIVGRGFNKFHNLNTEYVPETMEANLPKGIPLVTEKLDGSMGILYLWDSLVWVATRGSFSSDQAEWGTNWLRQRDSEDLRHYLTVGDSHSIVTEIIYPENRIVVDYDFEGLVITGCIDKETAEEVDRSVLEEIGEAIGIPVVKRFNKSLAECAGEDRPNEEGYVLTYEREGTYPLKVKVKFEEYCRLHRILTGLNPRSVWEMLVPPEMLVQQQPAEEVSISLAERRKLSVESILSDPKMPAGFIEWFSGWVTKLRSDYAKMEQQAKSIFMMRPVSGSRRDIAEFFTQPGTAHLSSVLFAMLDGKDYEPTIWKRLKPRGDISTYKRDGE